jgi:Leucine-rich repeat (LRR) protein
VDGLAKCTKLTSLDLKECESLQNVEPLIQLQELKVLSMEGCKKVDPLPRPMNMKTRSEVENYFRRILKKVGRKIPDSLKSKTPKDLKSNLAKIKKLILKRDYDAIDTGIELARALDEPAVFEMLLEGCSINEEGKIIRNKIFTGSGPIWVPGEWNGDKDHYESDEIYCGIAQSYLDYALVNLIGFQPKNAKIDRSLKLTNINKLNLSRFGQSKVKFVSWSRPEYYNKWDKIPSCIGKFRNITSIDISNFRFIKDLDIFSNLTNLTNLNLKWCSYLENVDGLAKLLKLTKLNLSICKSLQNMDGLANLTNLTTIKITPNTRLISSTMTTREEVAAYQEEIKKSMK